MTHPDDRRVLTETKGAWERAYNREPFHSGQAFSAMADAADEHHDTARQLVMR